MKKSKLSLVLLASLTALTSCGENKGVDFKTDYGIYFFGDDTHDMVRYNPKTITDKYFSKDKPTVLYFHGWQPFIDQEMTNITYKYHTMETSIEAAKIEYMDYAKKFKEEGYNIGIMWWAKYSDPLVALFERVWTKFQEGPSIAYKFATEYAELFKNYDQDIKLMGHSFGAQTVTATTYLLYKMKENNEISEEVKMPERVTLADPYIGDFALKDNEHFLDANIYYLNEPIKQRKAAEVVADCLEYLNNQGVTIDSYNAVDTVFEDYYERDKEKHDEVKAKLQANTCWTVFEGMRSKFGNHILSPLHILALDWISLSYFTEIKDGDIYYPTAGLETSKVRNLVGKEFIAQYEGLDLSKETMIEIKK